MKQGFTVNQSDKLSIGKVCIQYNYSSINEVQNIVTDENKLPEWEASISGKNIVAIFKVKAK